MLISPISFNTYQTRKSIQHSENNRSAASNIRNRSEVSFGALEPTWFIRAPRNWTPEETLQRARKAKKLIYIAITPPSDPYSLEPIARGAGFKNLEELNDAILNAKPLDYNEHFNEVYNNIHTFPLADNELPPDLNYTFWSLRGEAYYGEGVLIDKEGLNGMDTLTVVSAIKALKNSHFDGPIAVQNSKERIRFDNRNNELIFYGENGEFISYKLNKLMHRIALKRGKEDADYCDVFTYKLEVYPSGYSSPVGPVSYSRKREHNINTNLYKFIDRMSG